MGLSFARPAPVGGADYSSVVLGLPGGAPLAYWRMGEVSGAQITDQRPGARHGTYTGTIGYGAPGLPQASDTAVNFGGTGQGSVPHDAGLVLSAVTLSFWLKPNTIPGGGDPAAPILTKSAATLIAGNFVAYLPSSQGDILRVRVRASPTVAYDVDTAGETIVAGQKYHVCIRADNTGFDVFLNGILIGKNTNYTNAWTENTQNIRFADDLTFANDGDIVLDEVALFSRVVSIPEVLALAQIVAAAPTAVNDVAVVPESATTSINVLANDTYTGTPTLQIISQPTGGDSVAVNGQLINYTAGAVSVDTARSFTYRVTDSIGTSNTATVNVTVQDSGFVPTSIANCYVISGADTVVVNSMAALQSAVNAAPPGRQILIQTGSYAGGTLTFTAAGTEANPIVIRTQSGRGNVTISNPNWTLATGSARLVFADLFFSGGVIHFNGSHNRVTRCRFRDITQFCFRMEQATDARIDHCDFSGYVDSGTGKGAMLLGTTEMGNSTLKRILFDYNYIHDNVHPTASASNDIRAASTLATVTTDVGLIVDHCLWRNNTNANHGEFIVVKYSGATIRFCTFENIYGYLQQRQGGGWEVRSCWFELMKTTAGAARAACLHCFDDYEAGQPANANTGRQLIIGNRLVNHDMWVAGGDIGGDQLYVPPTGTLYHRSREGRYIGNNCRNIRLGGFWTEPPDMVALNNNLHNNVGTEINVSHTGTTHNVDNEAFVAAVKLAPADVGLAAPDPLCPSGPQS